jgi:hypothetical protein
MKPPVLIEARSGTLDDHKRAIRFRIDAHQEGIKAKGSCDGSGARSTLEARAVAWLPERSLPGVAARSCAAQLEQVLGLDQDCAAKPDHDDQAKRERHFDETSEGHLGAFPMGRPNTVVAMQTASQPAGPGDNDGEHGAGQRRHAEHDHQTKHEVGQSRTSLPASGQLSTFSIANLLAPGWISHPFASALICINKT